MTPERKAAIVLAGIAAFEGVFVIWMATPAPERFAAFVGFAPGRLGAIEGWLLSAVVTALFVGTSLRLPSVREWLVKRGGVEAACSGRRPCSRHPRRAGVPQAADGLGCAQRLRRCRADRLSAVAFGAVHGIWGVFGRSIRAATGATVVTGLLGLGLAMVYVAAGRSLAPYVTAHFLITALLEPEPMLAALRGEMGTRRREEQVQ